MHNWSPPVNHKHVLDTLLNSKPAQKSLLYQMLSALYYYFWLYCIIRKKSHRTRILKAARVFHLLQNAQFKEQPSRVFAYVRTIDPFVFEELLLAAFKSRGLKVIHNKRYTGDGGIDGIVILPTRQRIAIQAKRYQNHINSAHLKDFALAIKNHQCQGGFFIHSGKSGQAVYQNIPENIMLISGTNLHRLLVTYG